MASEAAKIQSHLYCPCRRRYIGPLPSCFKVSARHIFAYERESKIHRRHNIIGLMVFLLPKEMVRGLFIGCQWRSQCAEEVVRLVVRGRRRRSQCAEEVVSAAPHLHRRRHRHRLRRRALQRAEKMVSLPPHQRHVTLSPTAADGAGVLH